MPPRFKEINDEDDNRVMRNFLEDAEFGGGGDYSSIWEMVRFPPPPSQSRRHVYMLPNALQDASAMEGLTNGVDKSPSSSSSSSSKAQAHRDIRRRSEEASTSSSMVASPMSTGTGRGPFTYDFQWAEEGNRKDMAWKLIA